MTVPLAWSNTFQYKKRFITAAAGIAFSILLIFMQLGFLNAARRNAAFIYHQLDGDIAIVSASYLSMINPDEINLYRIPQAKNIEGIQSATGINFQYSRWINRGEPGKDTVPRIGSRTTGTSPSKTPVLWIICRGMKRWDTVLVDQLCSNDFGSRETGGNG